MDNNYSSAKLDYRHFNSPDFYPAQLSLPDHRVIFYCMSAQSYTKSPFLDHRIIKHSEQTYALSFKDIPKLNECIEENNVNYIFHNAFCSSTVLTRYLDLLAGALILREPDILYQIATLKRFEHTSMTPPLEGISWNELYLFVRVMISRRYDAPIPTILKPTDGCNNLMCDLVGAKSDNRALFIYSNLKHFLVSILRSRQRHEWAKIRIQELMLDRLNETGAAIVNPTTLSVEQAAALIWYMHTEKFILCAQAPHGERFKSLDSSLFLSNPSASIEALCTHFQLPYSHSEIVSCVENTNTYVNSKAEHEVYDSEQRRKEYEQSSTVYRAQIERAIEWLSALFPDRDLSSPMPQPLCQSIA